jgi:short-subunit dehydrogenase
VGTLLAGRGEEIMLAGRDSAKLDAARQRLSAHAASVSTLVLDISREEELVALSETLGEVNNIVVTAGSQAPGGLLSGWISARQGWPLIQNSGEASMSPAISGGNIAPAVR